MNKISKTEIPLMDEQSYEKYVKEILENNKEAFENGKLPLYTLEAVRRFKSVRRAIKRGHVTINGIIIPDRIKHRRYGRVKK